MRHLNLTFTRSPRFVVPLIALLLAIAPGIARSNDKGFGANDAPAVTQELSFWSPSLRQEMPYALYLPPGYASNPKQHYPVLYMLHGLGGDHDQWKHEGLFDAATKLIQDGSIEPMIIVAPEGRSGYWMNQAADGPLYGSYVAGDLVAMIDTHYRTIPDRSARAIGGMSMGGHGAFQLAMNHPQEFSIVGGHSIALRTQEQAFPFFGQGAEFAERDPVSLYRQAATTARSFTLWIDIGASDPWYGAAQAFHQQLVSEQVPHAWHLNTGAHDDAYWHAHVSEYLTFYGQAFAKNLGQETAPRVKGNSQRLDATVTAS